MRSESGFWNSRRKKVSRTWIGAFLFVGMSFGLTAMVSEVTRVKELKRQVALLQQEPRTWEDLLLQQERQTWKDLLLQQESQMWEDLLKRQELQQVLLLLKQQEVQTWEEQQEALLLLKRQEQQEVQEALQRLEARVPYLAGGILVTSIGLFGVVMIFRRREQRNSYQPHTGPVKIVLVNFILNEEQREHLDCFKEDWLTLYSPTLVRIKEVHFIYWECLFVARLMNLWGVISKLFLT